MYVMYSPAEKKSQAMVAAEEEETDQGPSERRVNLPGALSLVV